MPDESFVAVKPLAARRSLPRRWLEVTLFVACWMGLGWLLRLDVNSYLVLGMILTIPFQLWVRRASLRSLWVRDAPPFRVAALGLAAPLAALPTYLLVDALRGHQWIVSLWMASAMLGAFAAGYALLHFRKETIRPFLLCQLTAGAIGIGLMVAARAAYGIDRPLLPLTGLQYFFLYFPVCFALEEVSFRGALDSHLYQPGERFFFGSALFSSALWGIWHLPTLPAENQGIGAAIVLAVTHSLIGVPLAIFWRKSGNLVVPAFTHAFIDAVRNALRIMG